MAGWSRSLVDSKINYSSVHRKCTSILSWLLVCFSSAAHIVAQSGVGIGVPFEVDQLTVADESRDGSPCPTPTSIFFFFFFNSRISRVIKNQEEDKIESNRRENSDSQFLWIDERRGEKSRVEVGELKLTRFHFRRHPARTILTSRGRKVHVLNGSWMFLTRLNCYFETMLHSSFSFSILSVALLLHLKQLRVFRRFCRNRKNELRVEH